MAAVEVRKAAEGGGTGDYAWNGNSSIEMMMM